MIHIPNQEIASGRIAIERAHAIKRFGRYKDEKVCEIREQAPIPANPTIKKLADVLVGTYWTTDAFAIFDLYRDYVEIIRKIDYHTEDITAFSMALRASKWKGTHFDFRAGLFFSALINKDPASEVVLCPGFKLGHLGYLNTKRIVLNGDAGANIGYWMKGGELIINGNTGTNPGGDMRGGTIIIDGNVFGNTGIDMRGGELIVRGNVCGDVGRQMRGGIIRVEGKLRQTGKTALGYDMRGGAIFHKGTLVRGWPPESSG